MAKSPAKPAPRAGSRTREDHASPKPERAGARAPSKDAVTPRRVRRDVVVAAPRAPKKAAQRTPRSVKKALDAPPVVSPAAASEVDAPGSAKRLHALRNPPTAPVAYGRAMELHWGDEPLPAAPKADALVRRWMKRGDALLRHLAEQGAARHEYRADLHAGRFVWLSPEGRVSAEAQAQVICSYAKSTQVLTMAWADPLTRRAGIARIDGMIGERDDVDDETAWRIAMEAADVAKAEYLYRVTTAHAWYFLALRGLTFTPERESFHPGAPVGLVLKNLAETRQAIESRAEPAGVLRDRLAGVGKSLLQEARYVYRDTDWVARLERTGRRLTLLATHLPRPGYATIAAGLPLSEFLDREATIDLGASVALLEDEWAHFG